MSFPMLSRKRLLNKKHRKHELYDDLSKRELEVLKVLATGLSNQEIADELFISLKTVKLMFLIFLISLKCQTELKQQFMPFTSLRLNLRKNKLEI